MPEVDPTAADIRYEEEALGLTAFGSALGIGVEVGLSPAIVSHWGDSGRASAGLSDSDQVGISGPPS